MRKERKSDDIALLNIYQLPTDDVRLGFDIRLEGNCLVRTVFHTKAIFFKIHDEDGSVFPASLYTKLFEQDPYGYKCKYTDTAITLIKYCERKTKK